MYWISVKPLVILSQNCYIFYLSMIFLYFHQSFNSFFSAFIFRSQSRSLGVVIFPCPVRYFSNCHLQSFSFHFPHIIPYLCPFISSGSSPLAIQPPIDPRFFLSYYLIFQIIIFSNFIIISSISFLMFVPLSHLVYHLQSITSHQS